MAAVRKHWLPVALLCACMASLVQAAILPTDLEPTVGANYQPVGSDEHDIWQNLARVEESIRTSPQRLISPELDAYTRGVVERLIGRPVPELRIYIIHDASLNAAMLPSGMMIVNTGLLARVRDEAQFAAVLGHEAGHYFRRHSLDLYREARRKDSISRGAASALSSNTPALSSYTSGINGSWMMINQAILMSSYRFSRNLESEADAYGLMLMARAGYAPSAASGIWGQLVDERQASAAARHKSHRDGTSSVLSTHPPTRERMTDLADTAAYLAKTGEFSSNDVREEWAAVIRPHQALLLQEQIYLNDPGASLYLLESLAKDGWTGLLRFNEGEVYRLRNADGDDQKAAAAYAAAIALADAPPESWRAHGYALLKAGDESEANEALNRYLAMKPDAPDAALIRFMLTLVTSDEIRVSAGDMTVEAGAPWKRLYAGANPTRWEEVWTWNGPQIDRMTMVRGLPDGKTIIFQERTDDGQVPVFRADMTAQDLMSMVEVSYRVNGVTVFNFDSIQPIDFLGGSGVKLRYNYVSGIGVRKRGSCVMRVVDQRLYAMKLESLADRFNEVAPEFDRLVASAELRK